jgi:hypothetical protein
MDAKWVGRSTAEQRAFLNALADRCQLPHEFFLLEHNRLTIKPRPDEKYERVDCALEALQKTRGLPKMGFVGNEYIGNGQ